MKAKHRPIRFTIPTKVSFLVLATVLISIFAFAIFIFLKVKHEEEKAFAQTSASLGLAMGEQIWHFQEEIKRDMTNILALIDPAAPRRNQDSIKIILQKNPQLLYFEMSHIQPMGKGHSEILALFNENALHQKEAAKDEVRLQIERNILQFTSEKETDINYHFQAEPESFPIYIFTLDRKKRLYVAFVLAKDVFTRTYSPTAPVEVMIANTQNQVLFASPKSEGFPLGAVAMFIESRATNQGILDRFKESADSPEYAVHFYRAADGIQLFTFKNLDTAGLDKKGFTRDVIYFSTLVSLFMLAISFIFSRSLSRRLQRLMGLTENIVAGNYQIHLDGVTRDEVGHLAAQFKVLGQRLGERENRMEQVTELANRDGLTGVYNQRYFRVRLDELIAASRTEGTPLTLILMDIDHYKRFNDEYGHQQGDVVIQQLAHLLLSLTRKSDLVARYGGDEFAILLVNTEPDIALQIAERIREAFENKKINRFGSTDGETLSGTCSLGVANFDGDSMRSPSDLIQKADEYLYRAKRNGRNQIYSGA